MTAASGSERVLITGGAGFIGSHLCDRMLAGGHHVICLDDFSTGRHDNIAHLAGHPRFELVVHDVTRPFDIAADRIFNLACPASPPHYQRDPVQTMKTCVLGTLNALELATRLGVPVLQASTSEIYGDPLVHPQTEDYLGNVNPIGPRACYDEGKRAAETLCFDHHRHHGTDIRVIRIFNTYGPRMDPHDGRVVSNFVMQALAGRPITIYGDGRQTRSFCYIDDLVGGIAGFMAAGQTGPVNLGNPVEFTIRQLAETVIELTGSASVLEYRDLPEDDPMQRQPDIARIRALTGWEPVVLLRAGLARMIDHFRAHHPG